MCDNVSHRKTTGTDRKPLKYVPQVYNHVLDLDIKYISTCTSRQGNKRMSERKKFRKKGSSYRRTLINKYEGNEGNKK